MTDGHREPRRFVGLAGFLVIALNLAGCTGLALKTSDLARFDIGPAASMASLSLGKPIISTIQDGRRIVRGGDGVIWVLESGVGIVSKWSEAGENLGQFGTRGMENDQFVDPLDIDVATGMFVSVADASGRILRFSRDGAFAGSITLPNTWKSNEAPSNNFNDWTSPRALVASDVIPSAIAETEDGRLAVLDATSGSIMLSDRVFERFDLFAQLEGDPETNTSVLATGEGVIVLMEPALDLIRLFNNSGRETEQWTVSLQGVRAVQVAYDSVWLLFPSRVLRLSRDGLVTDFKPPSSSAYEFKQSGDWMDFSPGRNGMWLLTKTEVSWIEYGL